MSEAIAVNRILNPTKPDYRPDPYVPLVFGKAKVTSVVLYRGANSENKVECVYNLVKASMTYRRVAPVVLGICQAGAQIVGVYRDEDQYCAGHDGLRRLVSNRPGVGPQYEIITGTGPTWGQRVDGYWNTPTTISGATLPAVSFLTGSKVGWTAPGVTAFRAPEYRLMVDDKLQATRFLVIGIGGENARPDVVARYILVNLMGVPNAQVETELGPDGQAASSFKTWCDVNAWCRVNRAIEQPTDPRTLLDELLEACCAELVKSGDTYRVQPLDDMSKGAYVPPSVPVAIEESDIKGGVKVERVSGFANSVPVSFDDAAKDYETTTRAYLDEESFTLVGRAIVGDTVSNPWCTSAIFADRLSELLTKRSLHRRVKYTITIPARYAGLEKGDLVAISHRDIDGAWARIDEIEDSDAAQLTRTLICWESKRGTATPLDLTVQESEPVRVEAPGLDDVLAEDVETVTTAAETAQTTAETAQTTAETAQTTAETAQTTATTAASDVVDLDTEVHSTTYFDQVVANRLKTANFAQTEDYATAGVKLDSQGTSLMAAFRGIKLGYYFIEKRIALAVYQAQQQMLSLSTEAPLLGMLAVDDSGQFILYGSRILVGGSYNHSVRLASPFSAPGTEVVGADVLWALSDAIWYPAGGFFVVAVPAGGIYSVATSNSTATRRATLGCVAVAGDLMGGGSTLIAVRSDQSTAVSRSTNGTSWTSVEVGAGSVYWQSVVALDSLTFVIAGVTATGVAVVCYSTNAGLTWTSITLPDNGAGTCTDYRTAANGRAKGIVAGAVGKTLFVQCQNYTWVSPGGPYTYSWSGNWTRYAAASIDTPYTIKQTGESAVVLDTYGAMISMDGRHWRPLIPPGSGIGQAVYTQCTKYGGWRAWATTKHQGVVGRASISASGSVDELND